MTNISYLPIFKPSYYNIIIIDVPERPESVTAFVIQSRSLVLSWIKPHDNNAPIEGYFVLYTQPTFAGGEVIVNSTVDEMITLHELLPGVAYNFTVHAYNAIGLSIASEVIQVQTLEEGNHTHTDMHWLNSAVN